MMQYLNRTQNRQDVSCSIVFTDPCFSPLGYITEGFLVMQHALDKAIMTYHARVAVQNLFTNVTVFVQRFPYPEYYHDFFLEMLDIFTPLVILFIFAMNHLILVQSIVWEKENRLKVTPLSWWQRELLQKMLDLQGKFWWRAGLLLPTQHQWVVIFQQHPRSEPLHLLMIFIIFFEFVV